MKRKREHNNTLEMSGRDARRWLWMIMISSPFINQLILIS